MVPSMCVHYVHDRIIRAPWYEKCKIPLCSSINATHSATITQLNPHPLIKPSVEAKSNMHFLCKTMQATGTSVRLVYLGKY